MNDKQKIRASLIRMAKEREALRAQRTQIPCGKSYNEMMKEFK